MTRRIRKNEDGQALVEFALLAPILFLILFGIIQFGIAFKDSMALTDAVRTGARKATVSRSVADPVSATTAAVDGAATDLDTSKLNVTVTAPPWQPGATVTVTATYPYSINILGIVVASGDLHSSTTERVEY
jgi:Flp pilus assembly protein TadG